jgi:hypothetical protein
VRRASKIARERTEFLLRSSGQKRLVDLLAFAWERGAADAAESLLIKRMPSFDIAELAERFCGTPLPYTVQADTCATMPGYTGRTGTNLMTVAEADQFLRDLIGEPA